jgi:hypothetical protein
VKTSDLTEIFLRLLELMPGSLAHRVILLANELFWLFTFPGMFQIWNTSTFGGYISVDIYENQQ